MQYANPVANVVHHGAQNSLGFIFNFISNFERILLKLEVLLKFPNLNRSPSLVKIPSLLRSPRFLEFIFLYIGCIVSH